MEILYNNSVSKSKGKPKTPAIEVIEPPKIPTLNFGKRPSIFSGGRPGNPRGQVTLPTVRITQNKGGGGK